MQINYEIPNIIKTERVKHNGISYKYEIRSFESRSVASFGITLYEICVEMEILDEVSFYRTGGLFSDIEKALRFFSFLRENLATPYNIPYIVEDSFSF